MRDPVQAERILNGVVSVAEVLTFVQDDCYLPKRAAATFAGVGVKKIESAIRTGQLKAFRCGKKTLIKKSDLIAWVESDEITPTKREIEKNTLQNLTDRALERARANVRARKKSNETD